jgi:hypothetical protein
MARLGHGRYLTCYLFAAERHQTFPVAFFSDYHHKHPHPHRQHYPTFLKSWRIHQCSLLQDPPIAAGFQPSHGGILLLAGKYPRVHCNHIVNIDFSMLVSVVCAVPL